MAVCPDLKFDLKNYDLKTKEGAEAAAQEVAKLLGKGWVYRTRGGGGSSSFTVSLKKDGRDCGIEVTPSVDGDGDSVTAWVEMVEYNDCKTSKDPIEAVRMVRQGLKDRIEDLQRVSVMIS